MLPHGYELPAAVFLLVSGALTCFAGYRLFRVVLAIYGFILGAMLASSIVGVSNTFGMVVAGLAGGVVGALILVLAYFIGIALVGAGLGVLITHVIWSQIGNEDPAALAIALASTAGAIAAMILQRYVIVVSTRSPGHGPSWSGYRDCRRPCQQKRFRGAKRRPRILYPLSPAPGQRWVPVAWVILGVIGTAVQLGITGKKR
jgi:hypothetical protein